MIHGAGAVRTREPPNFKNNPETRKQSLPCPQLPLISLKLSLASRCRVHPLQLCQYSCCYDIAYNQTEHLEEAFSLISVF